MLVIQKVYLLGRNKTPTKTGMYQHTFVVGNKNADNVPFDKCITFVSFLKKPLNVLYMTAFFAKLDIDKSKHGFWNVKFLEMCNGADVVGFVFDNPDVVDDGEHIPSDDNSEVTEDL